MSLWTKILEKLGFKPAAAQPAPAPKSAAGPSGGPKSTYVPGGPRPTTGGPMPWAPKAPAPISAVDVVGKLEALANKNPQDLNWKRSIVDLLKLLGLESSLAERKELAIELGCPADKMGDSAQMNEWLHKTVLRKLAENGGNIPRELLD
ncbi:MAG TPA: DUF3597 domain-containing protein [Anaerolineales bacterium]|nr:DUF3597 domain-containing protein [Anaerolineales bacterium]